MKTITRQDLLVIIIAGAILTTLAMVYYHPPHRVSTDHPPHTPPTRWALEVLATAISVFEVDTGRMPTALTDLIRTDDGVGWNGPYIKGPIPTDSWGRPISYTVVSSNGFELRSSGPDGMLGNQDDITRSAPNKPIEHTEVPRHD